MCDATLSRHVISLNDFGSVENIFDGDMNRGEQFSFSMKEGNVLFNDALNTFYLRLYGVSHMVKDHTDSKRKPAAAT